MNSKLKFKQTEIGLIPEDWEVKILDTITERVCVGYVGTCLKDFCDENVGIPLFRTTNLTDEGLSYTDLKYVTKEFHNRNKKSQLKKGDLLIARHGDNGKACIFDRDIEANCLNVVIVKPNQKLSSSKYLLYCFKSEIVKNQVMANVGGSVQGVVNTKIIQNLLFPYPSIQEQSAIAKILSDLDSKIELLQKQNETLEKIGQAIFKQWFVDFEFPNEEGKPYKSSGGEMVESELGEIPKGWSVGNYGEILEFERGIEPGSRNYLDKKEDNIILFYRVGDLLSEDSTIYVKKDIIKNKIANKNNILVSFDGTVGRVKIGIQGSYSTGIRKVYSNDNLFTNGFIYFLMKSDFIQNKITEFAKGTTILHAGEAIKHFITVIPSDKIRTNFNIIAESTFEKLLTNINEIKNLQKTRDLLLPKLMTGKIRVPLEVPK